MQGQTKASIAMTCVKLLLVWGIFGVLVAKIVLDDAFGIPADVSAHSVQVGAVLAALFSVGCYAVILRWRRQVVLGGEISDAATPTKEHQDFFDARATWFVWAAIGFFLVVGATLGTTRMREAQAINEKASVPPSTEATFSPCKTAGMIAYQMTIKRDQGVPKEEMLRRYESNEIMNREVWERMVDLVYGHPERSPESIERAFPNEC